MIIGFDLSLRSCGIAILNGEELIYNDSILLPKTKKTVVESEIEMVDEITFRIKDYFHLAEHVVIEDAYNGINPKAYKDASRVQGGLVDRYYCYTSKVPQFLLASSARKEAGINAKSSKPEIQRYVCEKYYPDKLTDEVIELFGILQEEIDDFNAYQEVLKKRVKKKVLRKDRKNLLLSERRREHKNATNRLETKIKKATCIDEHMADAVILCEAMRKIKAKNNV